MITLTEPQKARLDKLEKQDPEAKIVGIDYISNCPVVQHKSRDKGREILGILKHNGRMTHMGNFQCREFWASHSVIGRI